MKKYSRIISVMADSIKILFRMDKPYLGFLFSSMVIMALIPFVNANLVSEVINLAVSEQNGKKAVLAACTLLGILTVLQIADAFVMWHRSKHYLSMCNTFDVMLADKTLGMRYEKAESPKMAELRMRAARGASAVQLVGESVTDFGSNLIKMVSCAAVFTMVNPLILLVVVPFAALNYIVSNYFQKKNYEQEQKSYQPQRRIDYFLDTMLDYVAGKEIRVFSATDFFQEKYSDREQEVFQIQRQKQRYFLADRLIGVGIVVIQLLFLYLLVGREYFDGKVNIGDISLYINLVLVFSGAFSGLFTSFAAVNWQGERLKDFKDYLALEDGDKELETEPVSEQFGTIVFEHVWFRYEGAEEYTLKDINLVIKEGDKFAIVGENGSGKTTLIKLLMRFYTPTKGRILVDGKDYLTLRQEDYYRLFSTVFQDFNLMAFTIGENIGLTENPEDKEKIRKVLERLELWEKIEKLPKGIDTSITREYLPDGVNFSGGERQKLSIARADFKNAPIMILDEPTSALDPIAEKKLYDKIYTMMEQKTMLMISHRLQSTAVCDYILFMKSGEITEAGSHAALMEQNGEYARMFALQANWYQETEE
ncbi:MAG: ABC transporter ATP-binding protein [Lachnospiraceae bacterium]|nr:ABC transporter ATP-binding protein [Lachnospiraceae bacterium]